MTTEKNLIKKSYYEMYIDENNDEHPVKALGKIYMEEMQKEQPNLSSIRFAQGEVYFLNQDYEAAIYKWQHPLDKQYIPWAQKNIADAHMEMGLLDYAEKFYKEVETESITLETEVLLQLFSLYIQQDNLKKSVETIKNAVKLNPDYEDVTKIAKRYFEEIQDWDSALELAVSEAIRTESFSWFDCLEEYAILGHTPNFEPNKFKDVLVALLSVDKNRFELLTKSLWKSYEKSDYYIQWLEEINHLILNHDWEKSYSWQKLPNLFKEAYFYLTSGKFLIKNLASLIPIHLTNWLEVTSVSDSLIPSTAVLAWNEKFPSELTATLINEAKNRFKNSNDNHIDKKEGMELLNSIQVWAEKEGLLDGLTAFMESIVDHNIEQESPSKIQHVIKDVLDYILEQKLESENVILQEMNDNEVLLTELHHFHQQLSNLEKEKASMLTSSFRDIKNKLMKNVHDKLPKLLQDCSALVKEDADFSKLHFVINEEMNKRIVKFMEKNVLPDFQNAFQKWILECEKEFQESQVLCTELHVNINEQFNEEKIVLSGDFKVLDDWKRDVERISRGLLRPREINILLRSNPSQLLLKGAGRLLAPLSRKKDMLLNRYKSYIENIDYSEVGEDTLNTFMQQLELFEESIKWDVNRFFSNPQEMLSSLIEEVEKDIEIQNESLNMLREKPEVYRDPLNLFELRLYQYELMNTEKATS